MKKHRWKDTTVLKHISKNQECLKCGAIRSWLWGDFQCWKYTTIIEYKCMDGSTGITFEESFKRPDCQPKEKEETFYCADWNRCGATCDEQCPACKKTTLLSEATLKRIGLWKMK